MRQPRTLCELFQLSLQAQPRPRAYLVKSDGAYHPVSAQQVADRVQAVAAALQQRGVQPGDRVAILAPNSVEWAIADYAILHSGAVTVPLYPTLQADAVRSMLADCTAMAAFVADAEQLAKLGGIGALPHLQHVVQFDNAVAPDPGRSITPLRDFETRGAAAFDATSLARVWQAVKPESLATIIYTSGTTGVPKGVMLSHANIVSNVLAALKVLPITADDTCLSFLPLSHIFERMAGHFVMWHVGACIALAESIDAVPANLLEVRPTVLIAVPRLYEKMNARIVAAVLHAPPLRQKLFAWAAAVGRERVRRRQARRRVPPWLAVRSLLADRLVFSKLRARLGGRMRLMASGGAPLSAEIAEFFFAARLEILEGYGLTETSPVICVNPHGRAKIGTVGPPLADVEVRIDTNGEILARGPNIMLGYYNKPTETAQALASGWFHTGDIGTIDQEGYLRITDRLKDLIVTSGGKNVAPQPIEARIKASPFVSEAMLIGDRRPYLSALIVPNFAALEAHALALGVANSSHTELVRTAPVRQLFVDLISAINAHLPPFERIKRFCILEREFQQQTGEITPTQKLKRAVVARQSAALIDALYTDPPPEEICRPSTHTEPHAEQAIAG